MPRAPSNPFRMRKSSRNPGLEAAATERGALAGRLSGQRTAAGAAWGTHFLVPLAKENGVRMVLGASEVNVDVKHPDRMSLSVGPT
jgi:hypothetical protein